jgi:hypothetical protein
MKTALVMRDFAVVTYAVDPDRLASLLPYRFEPDVFTLDDRTRAAFVSAVSFRAAALQTGAVRVPLGFVQVNYRAYVRHDGDRCVWFFGSTVSSPIVLAPRTLFRLPWYRASSTLEAVWDGARCSSYALRTSGQWGEAAFDCAGSGAPLERLDGFSDREETREVLTSPLSGYCLRPDGALLELRVEHEPLEPQVGTPRTASFEVFKDLNFCAPGTQPHSVLLLREAAFDVLPVRLFPTPERRKKKRPR